MNLSELEQKFTTTLIDNGNLVYELNGYHFKYFFNIQMARVNEAIFNLYTEGEQIDITSVWTRLKVDGKDKGIDLFKITESTKFYDNIQPILNQIKDAYIKRQWFIHTTDLIRQSGYTDQDGIVNFMEIDNEIDSKSLLEHSSKLIDKLQDENNPEINVVSMPTLFTNATTHIKQQKVNRQDGTFLMWGLTDLDKKTGGIGQEYVFIGADPSTGKTALAIHFILNNAFNHDILFFSLESLNKMITTRAISSMTGIGLQRMLKGYASKDDIAIIENAKDIFHKLKIHIVDSSEGAKNINDIKFISRKAKKKHDIKAIIIDYIQLVKRQGKNNREEELSNISKELLSLSRELEVPVISLSQMTGDELKYAKALSEDGDIKFVLKKAGEQLEIQVGKSRDGWTGTCRVAFQKETQRFLDSFNEPYNIPFSSDITPF